MSLHVLIGHLLSSYVTFPMGLFLLLIYGRSLKILDPRPLLDIRVVNMFLQFVACLFILFVVFLDKQSS